MWICAGKYAQVCSKIFIIKNKLQLNDGKTECFLLRPNKCTQTFFHTFLSVGHNVISLSTTSKNLGFYLSDDMTINNNNNNNGYF